MNLLNRYSLSGSHVPSVDINKKYIFLTAMDSYFENIIVLLIVFTRKKKTKRCKK